MSSPPIPDPYLALGLPKDTTAAQVKTTYRKLALKFHPDKVTDESLKASAADNFHRIQQAYEILSDEDRRAKYDATVKLAELRREVLQRQQQQAPPQSQSSPQRAQPPPTSAAATRSSSVRPEVRTAEYKVPLGSPRVSATFTARGPERYQDMRPQATYTTDEDYFDLPSNRTSSRKQSYVEKDVKKHSTRSDSERKVYMREAEKSSRSDRRRTVDKDRRRDRESKKQVVDDDSDSEELEMPASRRSEGRERERDSRYPRRHTSSDSEDASDEYSKKLRSFSHSAREYMSRSKQKSDDLRKSSLRNPAYDHIRPEYNDQVRRSSARSPPKESSYHKDHERQRQYSEPQVVFRNLEPFQRPPLEKNYSSPGERITSERRSKTLPQNGKANYYDLPPATMNRSQTMPTVSTKRPDGPVRTDSRMRQPVEMQHGLPTPGTSPPHDPIPTSKQPKVVNYIIGKESTIREVSPKTTSRQRITRSPSPMAEKRDSKSRSTSRRPKYMSTMTAPQPPIPHLPRLNTEPASYASHITDGPHTARPSLSRENSSPMFNDDYYPSRRRLSLDKDFAADIPYVVHDYKPQKAEVRLESGRSKRSTSTRPPSHMKRGNSFAGMFSLGVR